MDSASGDIHRQVPLFLAPSKEPWSSSGGGWNFPEFFGGTKNYPTWTEQKKMQIPGYHGPFSAKKLLKLLFRDASGVLQLEKWFAQLPFNFPEWGKGDARAAENPGVSWCHQRYRRTCNSTDWWWGRWNIFSHRWEFDTSMKFENLEQWEEWEEVLCWSLGNMRNTAKGSP